MRLNFKDELNFGLILNRAAQPQTQRPQQVSWHECHLDFPQDEKKILELLCDLQFLAEKEEALTSQWDLPPFFHIMSQASPLYRQMALLIELFKRPLVPTLKTGYRLILEFNPFEGKIEYPLIKKDLHWLLKWPEPSAVAPHLRRLLHYNFSVFHDSWHVIFALLIPCQRLDQLPLYFVFLEALVVTQEEYLNRELGPVLASVLMQSRTINSAPLSEPSAADLDKQKNRQEEFVQLFLENYQSRLEKKDSKSAWSPKNAVTKAWLANQHLSSYPSWMLEFDIGNLKRFSIANFEPEHLKNNPNILRELWQGVIEPLEKETASLK